MLMVFCPYHVMLRPPAELLDPIRQTKRHLDPGHVQAKIVLQAANLAQAGQLLLAKPPPAVLDSSRFD
jgi:hypothetical protein